MSTAEVTITENWHGQEVTWTARHNRKTIAEVTQRPAQGMWDTEPLTLAIAAHFGITARRALWDRPSPVRYVRRDSDSGRILPARARVDVPVAGGDVNGNPVRLCPRSGTRITPAELRGAAYVTGRGWQVVCPGCGKTPGSRADGHVILFTDHDAIPTCSRCGRPALGWPTSRPDTCSEETWPQCVRDPHIVAAENAAIKAAEEEAAAA